MRTLVVAAALGVDTALKQDNRGFGWAEAGPERPAAKPQERGATAERSEASARPITAGAPVPDPAVDQPTRPSGTAAGPAGPGERNPAGPTGELPPTAEGAEGEISWPVFGAAAVGG